MLLLVRPIRLGPSTENPTVELQRGNRITRPFDEVFRHAHEMDPIVFRHYVVPNKFELNPFVHADWCAFASGGCLAQEAAAQAGGQVGMAAGPLDHGRDDFLSARRVGRADGAVQFRQVVAFRIEVPQLDRAPDVVRRRAFIFDQFVGTCHTDQAKRKPGKRRFLAALVVHRADRREEIVGVIQLQRLVDFIDEDHDRLLDLNGDHLAKEGDQTLVGRGPLARRPPLPDIHTNFQIAGDFGQQTLIPVVEGLRSPQVLQIDLSHSDVPLINNPGHVRNEARFAHLAGGENVTILVRLQEFEHLLILRTCDVHVPTRHQRAANLQCRCGKRFRHHASPKNRA